MAEEAQEKTEKATPKRMRDVRRKGKLQRSQDLSAWAGVGAATLTLPLVLAAGLDSGRAGLAHVVEAIRHPDHATALQALGEGLGSVIPTVSSMLIAVVVVGIAGAALQGGIHVKEFTMKVEQFNPVSGLKNMFGPRALWNTMLSLMKATAVGVAVFFVARSAVPILSGAGTHSLASLLDFAGGTLTTLLQVAIVVGLTLAAADVFMVMRRNRKQTRMTKREIKDENKNTEGDPLIKAQRRSRQRALTRNRMIAAVADSDVVLVNPTHYAVALRYEPGGGAPRVVAKGAGEVAARIREEAEQHGVPLVRDIPLARALHAACRIGQEIPLDHYTAVAQVLAFVMALKRRGSERGLHTVPGRFAAKGAFT